MGSINTEEAARRLARVILSDIELYNRERPKPGETLEGQIEEGRRLFASRVTPDLLPVFGLVLSDRALGRVNSPAAAEPPSTPASTAAAVSPDGASPASNPTIQDAPTPAPSLRRILSKISPRPLPLLRRRPLSTNQRSPLKIRPHPPPRLRRILSRISPRPLPFLRRRPLSTNQRSPLKIRPHPPPRLPRILSRISPRPLPFLWRRPLSINQRSPRACPRRLSRQRLRPCVRRLGLPHRQLPRSPFPF